MKFRYTALFIFLAMQSGAYAQSPPEKIKAVQNFYTLRQAWMDCAKKQAEEMVSSSEPSEVVARAALASCGRFPDRIHKTLLKTGTFRYQEAVDYMIRVRQQETEKLSAHIIKLRIKPKT